ncbi:MAG: hypothetical protein IJ272_05765 [Clostridia bacterium]|nr:hypothetical protein [Clostridia bacterium]
MVLEIFIYLAIALGMLILCITMLEKDDCLNENYVILKRENAKVKVIIETEGLNDEDAKRIGWIIRRGKFEDIYDIANNFEIECK